MKDWPYVANLIFVGTMSILFIWGLRKVFPATPLIVCYICFAVFWLGVMHSRKKRR